MGLTTEPQQKQVGMPGKPDQIFVSEETQAKIAASRYN